MSKEQARELIAQADKKLGTTTGNTMGKISAIFFGGNPSHAKEDAVELLTRAGNILKMAKEWKDAGDVFKRAGDINLELESGRTNSAEYYLNAAKCYMKVSPDEAIACLMKTIVAYTDSGRFSVAAKYHVMVAEIYESNNNIDQAVEHYSKAADYYQCEESSSNASRCLLNVARYAAKLEQYQKAIQIYEEVGTSSVDSKLLKYGAKEHFMRAGFCHLCVDTLNAQIAIQKYEEICPSFADSRECKLLKDLISKIEDNDPEGFDEVVTDYDSISRFDSWFTDLLKKIKAKYMEAGDDLK